MFELAEFDEGYPGKNRRLVTVNGMLQESKRGIYYRKGGKI